jgi:hypothetical protein
MLDRVISAGVIRMGNHTLVEDREGIEHHAGLMLLS